MYPFSLKTELVVVVMGLMTIVHTMCIPQIAKYRVIVGDEDLAHDGASLILKSQRLFCRHASLNHGRRETHYKRSRHAILRMATLPLVRPPYLENMH